MVEITPKKRYNGGMKRQGSAPKFSTNSEERSRSAVSAMIADIFESAKSAPKSIISPDAVTKGINTLGKGLAQESKTEFNVALTQVIGTELKAGEEHSLGAKKTEHEEKKSEGAPQLTREFMQYAETITNPDSTPEQREEAQRAQQIEVVLMEIKKLKEEVKETEVIVKDVDLDKIPEDAGKQDLTFVEMLFMLVREARSKVQDVQGYAGVFQNRKAERSYKGMSKKHGTSFTLHHDRGVATQTG